MIFEPGSVRVTIRPKDHERFTPDKDLTKRICGLPYVNGVKEYFHGGSYIIASFTSLRRAADYTPKLVAKINELIEGDP